MSTRFVALLLVVALALAPAVVAFEAPTDSGLEEGIKQAQLGDFEKAVVTLDAAARRLAAEGGRSEDLARAYVYLSIAYLGLSQEQKAKAQFLEALKADTEMQLDEGEFPPRIMEFFEAAREEAVEEGVVEPTSTPAETTAAAEPVAETSTAAAEPEKKGGGSKKLLLIGGGAVAVAGIALAAGGGGGDNGGGGGGGTPVEETITLMSSDVPKGIPDRGVVSSQLNFQQSGTILEATLEFRIQHTCVGDLLMTLRHPNGSSDVWEGPGFGGDQCSRLWEGPLGFPAQGQPSAGNWVLEIADTRPIDAGVLEVWGLRLRIRR